MATVADEFEIAELTLRRVAHEHSITGGREKDLVYWERRIMHLEAQMSDAKIEAFQEGVAMGRSSRRLACFGEPNPKGV